MKALLLLCLFGTFSSACFASGNDCSFTGTVVDATSGKPMADVVIVAKGITISNEQKVITDEQGQFTIPSLPAGKYTLRFEKNNYKPVEKKNLIVKKNPAKLNVELLLEENLEDHHNWLLRIDFL